MTARLRPLIWDQAGLVYVEFLLCFIPVFVLFLGTVQLALIAGANLVVKHAAYRGARSASVVLADDPRFYGDEPMGHLGEPANSPGSGSGGTGGAGGANGGGGHSFLESLGRVLKINFAGVSGLTDADEAGARLSDIQLATYAPLSALTPSLQDLQTLAEGSTSANGLGEALNDEHWSRLALGLAAYNDIATVVRFPKIRHGDSYYEGDVDTSAADITVRVTHLFRCSIPVVAAVICRSARGLTLDYTLDRSTQEADDKQNEQNEQNGLQDDENEPSAREIAEQQLFDDLDHIPSRAGLAALGLSNLHVFVLKQESTVPSQWAPYPYPSGDDQ